MATQVHCERALEILESDSSWHKNVVGLGIVPANDYGPGLSRRDCAVAVYVKKKVPADRLPAKELVPDSLTISRRNGPIEIPAPVIEQGAVQLESAR